MQFQVLALRAAREVGVTAYALAQDLLRPVLRVAMPRAMRVSAPGGTVHVVARCNNREFYFTTPEDFEVLLAHLRALIRTYDVTVYAYTLMSNHLHLLLQAPTRDARAALRSLDRNPIRAGLVEDPPASPWSSGAAYALRTPNPLTTFHPSYLGLSPYPAVPQGHYWALLAPSSDPTADARDARWSTQRAVGTGAFVARYTP